MKPEELPQIISNKLEASMLAGILKAISVIFKMGNVYFVTINAFLNFEAY